MTVMYSLGENSSLFNTVIFFNAKSYGHNNLTSLKDLNLLGCEKILKQKCYRIIQIWYKMVHLGTVSKASTVRRYKGTKWN